MRNSLLFLIARLRSDDNGAAEGRVHFFRIRAQ